MKTTRRNFFGWLAAASALPGLSRAANPKPNIIFIMTDDQNRDMFNFLPEGTGNNVSPNIDRLAAEGTVFLQQHVTSAACTPSRYSLLTGRYASRARNSTLLNTLANHNMTTVAWNTSILSDDMTIGKVMQSAGYATGFVGKDHTVEDVGLQDIDPAADPNEPSVQAVLTANMDIIRSSIRACGFDYAEGIFNKNPINMPPTALGVHNMDWVAKAGLDFIDQYKDGPFFLYFSTTLTHGPRNESGAWGSNPLATPAGYLTESLNVLPDRSTIETRLTDAGLAVDTKRPNVLWLDDAVGALLDKIEALGLDDNTLIFFLDDHGVESGKSSIYQGGSLSVSIAWKKGGFPAGATSSALVNGIDFAPTLADFAGAEVPVRTFDGKSIRPILEGQVESIHESLYFEIGCTRAVLKDGWKYMTVRWPDDIVDPEANLIGHVSFDPGGSNMEQKVMSKYPNYYDADQLYYLPTDPDEQTNLFSLPEHAGKVAELQAELVKHLNPLPGPYAEFKTSSEELREGILFNVI